MKSRQLRQEYFINDRLAECGPVAHVLYLGLLGLANRDGRLEDRPYPIKVQVVPYYDCDVSLLLDSLKEAGLVVRYEVDGKRYIEISDFVSFQKVHPKESSQNIPAPNFIAIPGNPGNVPDVAIATKGISKGISKGKGNKGESEGDENSQPKKAKKLELNIPPEVDTPLARKALKNWLDYKQERSESYKQQGINSLIQKLVKWGPERFAQAVETSTSSNYAGLFEPKQKSESRDEMISRMLRGETRPPSSHIFEVQQPLTIEDKT